MKIDTIKIGGIANIKDLTLHLSNLNALLAPNNYGKSNVLAAIYFGIRFIEGTSKKKTSQMNYLPFISINKVLDKLPFMFEISGKLDAEGNSCHFIYGYSFEWAKTGDDNQGKGAKIIEEHLMFWEDGGHKKSYISRNDSNSAEYLSSPTGRCSKKMPVPDNMLALNKLNNFDDLFYIRKIRELNAIDIHKVDTLECPDDYFNVVTLEDDVNGFSTAYPRLHRMGFFIYSLKELHPDKYDLLKSTYMSLLDNIEDLSPVRIDLKKQIDLTNKDNAEKVPFSVPDFVYDIQVKETYNNQQTSISMMSSGCKKILYVLSAALAANINEVPLITFEELENSVHPKLLENLLISVTELAGDTKILTTSHSPYLIQYMHPQNILFGLPDNKGIADFRYLKLGKMRRIKKQASNEEVSIGEYLFDLMLDAEDNSSLINDYFE